MEINILISGAKDLRWHESYKEAVLQAGGTPHAAYLPSAAPSYDGLVLCGGGDMDPILYGKENLGSTEIDPLRDDAELALVKAYFAAGKPILGICRGHQLINAALGGTLIQDLPATQRIFHTKPTEKDPDQIHPIRATEGSVLWQLYGEIFPINSYHHQAVDLLGEGLKVTARSEAGIVEALEHKTLPILCVQFHPERMTGQYADPRLVDGRKIFDWFIARCRTLE